MRVYGLLCRPRERGKLQKIQSRSLSNTKCQRNSLIRAQDERPNSKQIAVRSPGEFSDSRRDGDLWRDKRWLLKDTQELPSPDSIRAQLRALLREASYLPDTRTREWWQKHIVRRYKEYHNDHIVGPSRKLKPLLSDDNQILRPEGHERLTEKLKEAKRTLDQLQKANEGTRAQLVRCILTAYGVVGKGSRQRMAILTTQQVGDNLNTEQLLARFKKDLLRLALTSEEKGQYVAGINARTTGLTGAELRATKTEIEIDLRLKILPPQLYALAKSQMEMKPPSTTKANPKRLQPSIPQHNRWMLEMPRNRRIAQLKRWYADLLSRILLPLPEEQWRELFSKALGTFQDDKAVPQRRRHPHSNGHQHSALDLVAAYGKVPRPFFGNGNARVINTRYMRRLYLEVFSACPCMHWDFEQGKWRVRWGHIAYEQERATQQLRIIQENMSSTDLKDNR